MQNYILFCIFVRKREEYAIVFLFPAGGVGGVVYT